MLPLLEAQAKERQGVRTDLQEKHDINFQQKIAGSSGHQARDDAAQLVGTNRQYVSEAKRIAAAAPERPLTE